MLVSPRSRRSSLLFVLIAALLLAVAPLNAQILPPPAAPDGFRGNN